MDEKEYEKKIKNENNRKTAKAVGVILLLLVAGVIGFVAIAQGNSCTLKVTIVSAHITEEVHYDIFIEGSHYRENDIRPMRSETWTIEYKWDIFSSKKAIEIKAISTGGGLGSVSDSETIVVYKNSMQTVILTI